MKIKKIVLILCIVLGSISLNSCRKEDPSVYAFLEGNWAIEYSTQSDPMTLRFYWHMGEFYCEALGTLMDGSTPDMGDGDGTYEVETYTDKKGKIHLEFSWYTEEYDDDDGEWHDVEHSRYFIYEQRDENHFCITDNYHLIAANDKSYGFARW